MDITLAIASIIAALLIGATVGAIIEHSLSKKIADAWKSAYYGSSNLKKQMQTEALRFMQQSREWKQQYEQMQKMADRWRIVAQQSQKISKEQMDTLISFIRDIMEVDDESST